MTCLDEAKDMLCIFCGSKKVKELKDKYCCSFCGEYWKKENQNVDTNKKNS